MNCQPQCVACNVFRHGEQFKFGKQLDNVYGKGTATVLEQLSKQIVKYSVDETKTLIQKYKQLIKEG
jgi:cytochrome c2